MAFFLRKTRVVLLSVAAALITMAMKFAAYWITNSVGLLSDAAESIINLAAAVVAFVALLIAARPADETHPYGHEKIEYLSSGVEGTLILLAAVSIVYSALHRLLNPQALHNLDLGLSLCLVASGLNFVVARLLLKAARHYDSITLEADARHLLTDVWTSVAVLVSLLIMRFTSVTVIDPLIALVIALNIIHSGINLLKRSFHGLMDYRLPGTEMTILENILQRHVGEHRGFHNLRTRKSGSQRFIEFHLLVPGSMLVKAAHDLSEQIENDIREQLANTTVTVHVEPEDELASYQDVQAGLRYGKL